MCRGLKSCSACVLDTCSTPPICRGLRNKHKFWSISLEFVNVSLGLFIAYFTSMISFLAFNHTLHAFWPRFWDLLKNLGFIVSKRFLQKFWDGLCENGSKSSWIASHLHYNNVSCMIVVCLLCWTNFVLVGLDWIEPMMFLLLHITCLCIFMHTYLTFSIFLYNDSIDPFPRVSFCLSLSSLR